MRKNTPISAILHVTSHLLFNLLNYVLCPVIFHFQLLDMDIVAERSYPTPLANVTLLPMLLMSLMRQKNCPRMAENIKREYDYVIVGAGSAGSVVASRLSELSCVSVLLLEAGKPPPLLTDVPALSRFFWFTDIDWQYKTVPQKRTGVLLNNRQVVWPGGKAIGGSSILNGMVYVRGNRKNFDQWATEGAEGWSYKDVLPYFKKMEDNRDSNYVANGYHGIRGPQTVHRPRYQPEMRNPLFEAVTSMGYRIVDPNGPFQTGFYDLQSTMRAGQRCSTVKAYLVPAENRTNLDILPNAFVRKILIKKRRAVGVQFDYEGKTYVVNAKREVILSAGTINTAQLLMLSGIGPRSELERLKIPVVADLPVGRNLQDHCSSNVDFELDPSIQPVMEKLTDLNNIARYIQNRTGPLGSSEFFNAIAFLKNKVIQPGEDFPDHQILFAESNSGAGLQFGLTPEAQAKIYKPYEGKPFYSCFSSPLQPRSRGSVTLRSDDPYDPPLIDPNYFDDARDIDDLIEGLKVCNRIGNSPTLKKVGSVPRRTLIPGCEKYAKNEDLYLRCQVRAIIFTASHPVGTARMGNPKDPRTVVDPELRVKTLEGLRVIDASVMPIIPSGNIYAATVMIAEKASDIIKPSIECYTEETDDDRFPVLEEIAFSGGPVILSNDDKFPVLEEIAFSGGPVILTQSAAQTSNKRHTQDSILKDSQTATKSIDKPHYENIPLNEKQRNSDLKSSETPNQSKDISVKLHNSGKSTDKRKFGYVPVNKKQRNLDLQPSEKPKQYKDRVLATSQDSGKSTDKPEYTYVPVNKKERKSDLQSSKIPNQSKNTVLVTFKNSDKSTDKPQYEYISANKNNWKEISPSDFTENEHNLSSEPWNREIISPDFTDFVFSGNKSLFQNSNKPFDVLAVRPYIKQAINNTRTLQSPPQTELLSGNIERNEDLQTDHEASQKAPRSKPNRPQKIPPIRIQSQKSTKSDSIIAKNKKLLPSKFDSLRVKIDRQKSFLLSLGDNEKKFLEDTEENLKQSVPDSKIESPAVNPSVQSDSEFESYLNSDSNESRDVTSSCEEDFCDSLVNFMKCGETKSCQKKVEFASLLYQLLCINE